MGIFKKGYKSYSDEQLMELIIRRDSSAFDELYSRYSGKLINYFYRMLWQDREKAEDFMQDLFMKIVHRPEMFNTDRKFSTWMYSVANNMCKNEYRKKEIRKDGDYVVNPDTTANIELASMEKRIDRKDFVKRLYAELDELDEKQRGTFILRYEENYSIKEISEVYECSEGTVKSRLFYTIKKLAAKLEDYNPDLDNDIAETYGKLKKIP